jgi:hypothetical protein
VKREGEKETRKQCNHVGANLCVCPGSRICRSGADTQVCPYDSFIKGDYAPFERITNQLCVILHAQFSH